MKIGLKLAVGIGGAVLVVTGALAGEVAHSRPTMAVAGYSHAAWRVAGCRQVCAEKVRGRCIAWRQVCTGGGAVRG